MIGIIKNLLLLILNDIDSGNSNISEKDLEEIIDILLKYTSEKLSKIEAAEYVGVSRATFDNYINKGLIPKGKKRLGFKELSWNKSDLDNYINNYGNIK